MRLLLVPYLDREATAEEARLVETHVAECAACARDLARHRTLSVALEAICSGGADGAPQASGPQVAHAVRREARRTLQMRVWAARVAAAALVACGLLWLFEARTPVPAEDLLTHLEILEELEEEGVEPSQELVQVLLDTVSFVSEPRLDEFLDADLADEVLPDELFPEKS